MEFSPMSYEVPETLGHHHFSSGDPIVVPEDHSPLHLDRTYFLEKSINDNSFTLYSYDRNTKELIYLQEYDEAQGAIDALSQHSAIGSPGELNHSVYRAVCYHLDEKTELQDLLLNILTIFKYHTTQYFDHLVQTLKILNDPSLLDTRPFPYSPRRKAAFNQQTSISEYYLRANPVARIYANLYDLVVLEYDRFSDKKFDDRKPEDFRDFLKSVLRIFNISSE